MDKMKECKSCGAEIAQSAKTCPHCGAKNKKPFYKAVWFWVVIIIVLIIALSPGGSEEPNTDPIDTGKTTSQGTNEETIKTEYVPGDVFNDGYIKVEYVSSSTDYTDISPYADVPDGYKVVVATFNFENVADDDQYVDFTQFECYADDVSCESFYSISDDSYFGFTETLSSGKKALNKSVYYTVPENAESIVIEYEPNFILEEKFIFVIK